MINGTYLFLIAPFVLGGLSVYVAMRLIQPSKMKNRIGAFIAAALLGLLCLAFGYHWGFGAYPLLLSSREAHFQASILRLLKEGKTDYAIRCLEGGLEGTLTVHDGYLKRKSFLFDPLGGQLHDTSLMGEVVQYSKDYPPRETNPVCADSVNRVLKEYEELSNKSIQATPEGAPD